MATRIISWAHNEHVVSPSLSKTPSIVTVNSILGVEPQTSPAIQGAPHGGELRTKHVASQVLEPNGTRTLTAVGMYPGPDAVDGSFVRHHKYFFTDGNVTFLVDNTLYCVHRYFFSRDSIYFSTRFALLNIRDHEALPTIISLGDIGREDFDAFLSVLYPENFEQNDFSYEEWKSVLHLSTHWGFASIRKLALGSIEPPTPHDRLLLARKYSVGNWVVPALSALCERTAPLTLSEARQMDIEDVVLVSTVREDIRSRTLRVDASEIPRHVEAEQAWALAGGGPRPIEVPPAPPMSEPSSPMNPKVSTKGDDVRESDSERSTGEEALGNINVRKEPAQPINNNREAAPAPRTVETEVSTWFPVNQVADEVAAEQRRAAKREAKKVAAERRAKQAAARREEAEIKHEAEEAVRREAEVPMAPGKWGGGWKVKPAAEQQVGSWWGTSTSDPSASGWGGPNVLKGRPGATV